MQKVLVLVALAGLLSCASAPVKDEDLLLSDSMAMPSHELCGCDIRYDTNILSYALKNGYGGRKYVPQQNYNAVLADLDRLQPANISPDNFCQQVGDILSQIPDMHLSARLNNKVCGNNAGKKHKPGSVGKNFSTDKTKTWEVNYVRIKRNKIPVLSIKEMPAYEEKAWDGFESALKKIKSTAHAVIIDMRGNGGGSDSRGLQMASYFFGQDNPSPIKAIIKSQTPATFALLANSEKKRIQQLQYLKSEVPEYLLKKYSEKMEKFRLAKEKKLPEEAEIVPYDGPPYNEKKAFTKPIVLLMDKNCASSCEDTGKALLLHPKTVFIGENTGGFLHYGNVGLLVLPKSKISVQLATDFWKYSDGQFLEGIGIEPNIKVNSGEDAMNVAKEYLKKELK